MRAGRLSLRDPDALLERGFAAIRTEMGVPTGFDRAVVDEAAAAAERGPGELPGVDVVHRDARDIALVSIDPAGSRDLDQAVAAHATKNGFRLWYAIADVAPFVTPGGALDAETHSRGVTLYSPDLRTPLHPEILSEDAASLFPGVDRPAVLWTFDLDADAEVRDVRIERAIVRNNRAFGYREAQNLLDSGRAGDALVAVAEIGRRRAASQAARGAVDLRLPDQEIRRDNGNYALRYERELPVEAWNAQISLLTGATAARMMIHAGVGILRTLPRPDHATIEELRESARTLGVDWSPEVDYPTLVRRLDPADPAQLALMYRCARGLRGAGYLSFVDGNLPDDHAHYALAGPYAHVTAPLRRLVDRYANEILLATSAGRDVPEWVLARLDELPTTMNERRRHAAALHRTLVDYMEAAVLRQRVGDTFTATIIEHRGDQTVVHLDHPAVMSTVASLDAEAGERVRVRLEVSDPDARRLRFTLA